MDSRKRKAESELDGHIQKKPKEELNEENAKLYCKRIPILIPPSKKFLKLLAPHEFEFVSSDPWNLNFLASTWSNDAPLMYQQTTSQLACGGVFPLDLYRLMFEFCSGETLFVFRRTSKFFKHEVSSSKVWKSLFYSRRWRLPHELKNYNYFKEDPTCHISVPDQQIDWFKEFRRNHRMSMSIRVILHDISDIIIRNLQIFKVKTDEINFGTLFVPGVMDEELDAWEAEHQFWLPNDLREYYKCVNGGNFCLNNIGVDDFPQLSELSLTEIAYYNITSGDLEEDIPGYAVPQELNPGTPAEPPIDFYDCDSSGDDTYEEDDEPDSDESDEASLHEDNVPQTLLRLMELDYPVGSGCELYEPTLAGTNSIYWNDGNSDMSPAFTGFLEHLDQYRERAETVFYSKQGSLSYCLEERAGSSNDDSLSYKKLALDGSIPEKQRPSRWDPIINEIAQEQYKEAKETNGGCLYEDRYPLEVSRRAKRLLVKAAKDYITTVFARAQSMEPENQLMPDTLIRAANELPSGFKLASRVTSKESTKVVELYK